MYHFFSIFVIHNKNMTISKIIETVFIKEFNSTAIILENDIILQCHTHIYMNYSEHIEYVKKFKPGLVQTANFIKRNKSKNINPSNPLKIYDDIYKALYDYANNKLGLNIKEPKLKFNF